MPTLENLMQQVEENRHHLPAQAVTLEKDWELCFYASGQDARTFAHIYNEKIIHDTDRMAAEPIQEQELKQKLEAFYQ